MAATRMNNRHLYNSLIFSYKALIFIEIAGIAPLSIIIHLIVTPCSHVLSTVVYYIVLMQTFDTKGYFPHEDVFPH